MVRPGTTVFSWPYPRDIQQLIHVTMVIVALLLAGLAVTANRYHTYKNQVLDRGNIVLASESLSSYAAAADRTLTLAGQGKTGRSFRQAYADRISQQVKDVVQFLSSRQTVAEYEPQSRRLVEYGSQLQTSLAGLYERNDDQTLKQTREDVHVLSARLDEVKESL